MAIPKKTREVIHKKFDERCAYCGIAIEYKEMQVDHIIAKKMFPIVKARQKLEYHTDDEQNLNPSCRVCNNFKGCYSIKGFRRELQKQVLRGMRASVNFRMAHKYKQIIINEVPIVFWFEQYELDKKKKKRRKGRNK